MGGGRRQVGGIAERALHRLALRLPRDQDDDPRNVTDCEDGSTQDTNVRAAELQLFR